MIRKYKRIILGATVAGIGAAAKAPEDCIVLEESIGVGYEYINSYKIGGGWEYTTDTILKKELVHRKLLSHNHEIYLPPVAFVLYNLLQKSNINVLFLTKLADIRKSGNGYCLEIYNANGFSTIYADEILDTTYGRISLPDRAIAPKQIYLNGLLNRKNECQEKIIPWSDKVRFKEVDGRNELVFSIKIESYDWCDARKKIHNEWKSNFDKAEGWTLSYVATEFDVCFESTVAEQDNNIVWLPSCQHKNLLDAWQVGYDYPEVMKQ